MVFGLCLSVISPFHALMVPCDFWHPAHSVKMLLTSFLWHLGRYWRKGSSSHWLSLLMTHDMVQKFQNYIYVILTVDIHLLFLIFNELKLYILLWNITWIFVFRQTLTWLKQYSSLPIQKIMFIKCQCWFTFPFSFKTCFSYLSKWVYCLCHSVTVNGNIHQILI